MISFDCTAVYGELSVKDSLETLLNFDANWMCVMAAVLVGTSSGISESSRTLASRGQHHNRNDLEDLAYFFRRVTATWIYAPHSISGQRLAPARAVEIRNGEKRDTYYCANQLYGNMRNLWGRRTFPEQRPQYMLHMTSLPQPPESRVPGL